jgi:hypothetical protein
MEIFFDINNWLRVVLKKKNFPLFKSGQSIVQDPWIAHRTCRLGKNLI